MKHIKQHIQLKLRRDFGDILLHHLEHDRCTDIAINNDGRIWVDYINEAPALAGHMDADQIKSLLSTLATFHDVELTKHDPILECMIPGYSARLEALIPPVVSSPVVSIRKPSVTVISLQEMVDQRVLTKKQHKTLQVLLTNKKNILIAGGTGSGKTTLVNALLNELQHLCPQTRVVILEDTPEINSTLDNSVQMMTSSTVTMDMLLNATLRLNPDRIVVGEVRGVEAETLLKAWNTGHPGGMCSIHANSAEQAIVRLKQLVSERLHKTSHDLIHATIDAVVFIEKMSKGRKITDILITDNKKASSPCV